MQFNLSLSATQTLYYFAPIRAAEKAIMEGSFLLSTNAAQSDAAHGAELPYFLSMTRSRQGRYHRNDVQGVLFELDGRALAARHKIRPVDYWQFNSTPTMRNDSNEMEERLYSKKPRLKLAGIVKGISVLVDPARGLPLDVLGTFTVSVRKEYGIVPTLYTNAVDWKNGNKAKAVSPSDIPRAERAPRARYSQHAFAPGRDRSTLLTDMTVLLKTLRAKPDFDMYDDIYDLKINSRHRGYITSYHRDLYSQLGAEFQNASRAHTMGRPKERKQLERLLSEMQYFKMTTPKQLADFLIARHDAGRIAANERRKASEPQTNDEW